MNRVLALILAISLTGAAFAAQPAIEVLDPNMAKVEPDKEVLWFDVLDLGLEGRGWTEVASPYDRLPAKAEGVVRDPVWSLSRHSAGMCVRFVTDSPSIAARWTLRNESLGMNHMPPTGVSGLDLYARDGDAWRWVAVGRPTEFPLNEASLVGKAPSGRHEYLLYLPLYNGVESVEVGIAKGATMAKAAPRPEGRDKPIVFYGTSITQGGCASRPGMAYSCILGRRFDRATINLGFSGNGEMEPEMAELLAELDPAVYVLAPLPNMDAAQISERYVPFVKRLREAHPETPIVLVGHIVPRNLWFAGDRAQRVDAKAPAMEAAWAALRNEKVKGLLYVAGEALLGNDDEGTVDGVHPTDIGFRQIADALHPAIKKALK